MKYRITGLCSLPFTNEMAFTLSDVEAEDKEQALELARNVISGMSVATAYEIETDMDNICCVAAELVDLTTGAR